MANQFTYDKLGMIVNNGSYQRANQNEIMEILCDKMRDIYGNDIDLSSSSADAQYIMMETLILNNIYEVLGNIYSNINPKVANGIYLDALCSLTNVKRKEASQSTVSIYLKNTSNNTQTINAYSGITLQDKNNIEWKYVPIANETINSDEIIIREFTCSEYGPNAAIGVGTTIVNAETDIPWDSQNFDSINGSFTLLTGGSYKIYQPQDAILGNNLESDDSLRARQKIGASINSYTTIDGLKAALYNLESINDCYIFNNASDLATSDLNGMTDIEVDAHNVYIALRYKDGVVVNENEIAVIINNRMTPGVLTQDADGTLSGTAISNNSQGNTIYWKKCAPDNPKITLTYLYTDNYDATLTPTIGVTSIIDSYNNIYTLNLVDVGYYEWIDNLKNKFYTSVPASITLGSSEIYLDPLFQDSTGKTVNRLYYTAQERYICESILTYLNLFPIGEKLLYVNLLSRLQSAATIGTIIAQTCAITGGSNNYYLAPCTFFNYTIVTITYNTGTATVEFD